MFGINEISATWLSIPATYATGFGFIFSYGRLMLAMSESRLLPRVLRIKWGSGDNGTPSLAFLIGSGIGFLVCIFVYFFPAIQKHLFNICILFAFGAYTSQFIGFINLRTRFIDLPRLYHSPLGIFGACLGTLIFTLAAISVIAFQKDGFTAFIAVLIIAALNSTYYFCSAKHHQKFSRDELKTLFNAHVFKCKYSDSLNAILKIRNTQCFISLFSCSSAEYEATMAILHVILTYLLRFDYFSQLHRSHI
jgi:amino acid transporter